MIIPVEIVLKIVSHLHTPITYRHYERYQWLGWWRVKTADVILEVRKYDESTRNVTAAKNFRLVCSDFAYAYGPAYIYTHIGGTIMYKPYSIILSINNKLSKRDMMTEYAYEYLQGLKNRTKRMAVHIPCSCGFHGYSRDVEFPSEIVDNILKKNVLLIYNNTYVGNLIKQHNKQKEDQIKEEKEQMRTSINRLLDSLAFNIKKYDKEDKKELGSSRPVYLDFSTLYPSLMMMELSMIQKQILLKIVHKSMYGFLNHTEQYSRKSVVGKIKEEMVNNKKKKNDQKNDQKITLNIIQKFEHNHPDIKKKSHNNLREKRIKNFQNYKPIKGNTRKFKMR